MAVYPRGNGFQVDFQLKGNRYQGFFNTEPEAERWEFDVRAAVKQGLTPPEPNKPKPTAEQVVIGGLPAAAPQGLTMDEALKRAKEMRWAYKRGSSRTVLNAENFVKWVGGDKPASYGLSLDKVHAFVRHLIEERKIKGVTINKYLSAVSVIMEYADVPHIKLPYQEKGASRQRFFTEEEVALVIQTLTLWGKHKERDLFIFLVDTGARPYSEACTLRWEQIRDRRVTFGEYVLTKNNTQRTIPLTTRAFEAVERMRRTMGNHEGPWVDISEWRMIEVWRNVRAHLPQLADTVVYTARHTCCTWQVQKGIDLMRVMKWMGHKSYQTTLGYAHHAPDHLMDNLSALEGVDGPKLLVINGGGTPA